MRIWGFIITQRWIQMERTILQGAIFGEETFLWDVIARQDGRTPDRRYEVISEMI